MKKVFLLEGLDCANCAAKIEKAVSELDGVKSASVNFITTKLTIETEEDTVSDEFLKKIKKTAKKTDSDVTVKNCKITQNIKDYNKVTQVKPDK